MTWHVVKKKREKRCTFVVRLGPNIQRVENNVHVLDCHHNSYIYNTHPTIIDLELLRNNTNTQLQSFVLGVVYHTYLYMTCKT